jgi:hypothetical protein
MDAVRHWNGVDKRNLFCKIRKCERSMARVKAAAAGGIQWACVRPVAESFSSPIGWMAPAASVVSDIDTRHASDQISSTPFEHGDGDHAGHDKTTD